MAGYAVRDLPVAAVRASSLQIWPRIRAAHTRSIEPPEPSLSMRVDRPSFDRTRPRVAFIVDHPQRDLAGLTLTAFELCQKGIHSHLVPLNLQQTEVFGL